MLAILDNLGWYCGVTNIFIRQRQIQIVTSHAFADTPIGQSLLKLDESQRKRLESLFNTAYSVVVILA
jgi:hypothetical protein